MGRDTPGEFEQIVLLALAGQEGEGTGRMVYEAIKKETGRERSVAAVHITLGRLVDKGWAECTTLVHDPVRGGKPRRRYSLSPAGAVTLKRLRGQLDRLWEQATRNPLLGDGPP